MRAENSRRRFDGRQRERGASLVLVSGALVAFVAVAALAVDYGQLVVQRRAMVTATDAASLAAATVLAKGGDEVTACNEASAYMSTNAPDHETFACDPYSKPGVVEVSSSQTVSFGFATVFGMSSGTAQSSTASEYIPGLDIGIRPLMLCDKADPAFDAWLDTRDKPMTLKLTLQNAVNPAPCDPAGQAAGNWGTIDFDGGSNPLGEIAKWIEFGYDGTIATSSLPDSCVVAPVPEAEACYNGDPGNIAQSLEPAMTALKNSKEKINIPVFELAEEQGGNLVVRVKLLIIGELKDFKLKGSPKSKFIELQLYPDDVVTETDPAVRICGAVTTDCP